MRLRFFPWRFFSKIFLAIVFTLVFSFVFTIGIEILFLNQPWSLENTLLLALIQIPVMISVAAFLSFRLSWPFRRIILKALRIASKKNVPDYIEADSDLYEQESSEFYELEHALDRIRKKMQKRRNQLAHEREEAQTLMSFLADAVVSVDRDEKIKFFNSNFATQFLPTDQAQTATIGQDLRLSEVFRDPEILEKVKSSLKSGHSESLQRKIITRLDNVGRDFLVKITPLREAKTREIYGSLVLFHDVSELTRTQQIRAQFVENASHELRTPLTSIKGYLSTAKEDAEARRFDQLPQFLQIISRSVDRLIELVNDMLTISGLESNWGLNLETLKTNEVTSEVIQRLSPLATQKKIRIQSNYNCDSVKADSKLLEQVLTNLIGNAIKYIPEGSQINVDWIEDDQATVLHVKDTGPGIAEEHVGRLFERFYRVDKSRSRDIGGTGLGLAIVKHVMQSHGGSVSVKSKVGQGSEFICRFPF